MHLYGFPQNERGDAFSDVLLCQMTSRTLYRNVPSLLFGRFLLFLSLGELLLCVSLNVSLSHSFHTLDIQSLWQLELITFELLAAERRGGICH